MRIKQTDYHTSAILADVSRKVSSSLDLDRVSDLVLKESTKALDADHASLFLLDERMKHLVLARACGFSENEMDNIKLLGSWEVINDQLITRKKPLIVNDVSRDLIFKRKRLPFSQEKIPVKSFLAVPLEKGPKVIGALIVSNKTRPGHVFTDRDKRLLVALSNHIAIALLNAKLYHRLKELFISTVRALVRAIDAKDRYTSGHSERVMKYSLAIGRQLKLNEEMLENLRLSSLLHDVGKIGIKENVLSKPSRLTHRERNQVMAHPAIGVRIVGNIDGSRRIINGILEHHERYDGKGYPNNLKGDDISLEGRIIAVSDAFDALTTNRPYQRGYSNKEAFFEIKRASSSQFDPRIIKAFITSFSKHPEIWRV